MEMPRKPLEIEINAGPVPLTDSRYEKGSCSLGCAGPERIRFASSMQATCPV